MTGGLCLSYSNMVYRRDDLGETETFRRTKRPLYHDKRHASIPQLNVWPQSTLWSDEIKHEDIIFSTLLIYYFSLKCCSLFQT